MLVSLPWLIQKRTSSAKELNRIGKAPSYKDLSRNLSKSASQRDIFGAARVGMLSSS